MPNRYQQFAIVLLCFFGLALTAEGAMAQHTSPGFIALKGEAARTFQVPADLVKARKQMAGPHGLTITRYQQMFGQAEVLGGQLAVHVDQSGAITGVIGAHFPNLVANNQVKLAQAQAQAIAAARIGDKGEWFTTLRIDPSSGRFFYQVENRRFDSRWFHWIDAETGEVINAYDGLTYGSGTGVTGDTKDLGGLTTRKPKLRAYVMLSQDGRQTTYDAKNKWSLPGQMGQDKDDLWNTPGRTSPGQPALVDAQFYAKVTDRYYLDFHSFNWVDHYPQGMRSSAHYRVNYSNAYWNGSQMVYGDGDGVNFLEFSGDLDIVAHELSHGVTDATSKLIYKNESGALNESFSDIMGTAAEFYNGTGNWTLGEDIMPNDTGIRDMANPGAHDQPSHYDDRYQGSADNGGVHTNSGISNHWFYLLVNGGQNANPDRASGTDVIGIGLAAAEEIAFSGFTNLTENANFCDARAATIVSALPEDQDNVAAAWDEVGVVCN